MTGAISHTHDTVHTGSVPKEAKFIIKILEQVTDFKHFGYRISEYGSDLEDKLQTYNKINGVIRRHFGKTNEQRKKVKNSHYC